MCIRDRQKSESSAVADKSDEDEPAREKKPKAKKEKLSAVRL